MELDIEDLDEWLEFFQWPGVQRFMKVPRRFKSPDVEIEFSLWHEKKGDRSCTNVLTLYIVALVLGGISGWEDFANVEQLSAVNLCAIVRLGVTLTFTMLLYLLRRVRPSFFTERRKIAFAIFVILEYYTFGNRAAVVSYFRVDWPYSERQVYPQQIWSTMTLMLVVSLSCNTSFSRCCHSWVLYPASLIISIGNSVQQVVGGHTAIAQALILQGFVLAHVHTVFHAQASAEIAERLTFMHVLHSKKLITQERVLRYTAERQVEDALPPTVRRRAADEASAATSQTMDVSSAAFHLLHIADTPQDEELSLQAIRAFGEQEHWLIEPEDLQLLPACMLGVGGFGSAVAGIWKQARVAVKVHDERGSRHRNAVAPELRLLRKLRHPNVVSFLGVCIPSSLTCLIVEELVIGETLAKMFAHLGAFAIENCQLRQHVILDISAALHYLHGQEPSITHGDLKPGNVLVEYKTCKMKLTDFGLSRRENTRDVVTGGTPKWQEPALRSRDRDSIKVHTGTDIWALGAVSFFLCSGLSPSQGSCISGSSSFEGFGGAVQQLWAGPSADVENSQNEQIELADPEDLEACRSLCISCMNPGMQQRPTARSVHEQVCTWKQSQRRSWLPVADRIGSGEQADTLLEDLAEVRELARELRSSRFKQVPLPKDVCDRIYDEFIAQAKRLQTLPNLKSCSDAVQFMQLILEMVSWETRAKACLMLRSLCAGSSSERDQDFYF